MTQKLNFAGKITHAFVHNRPLAILVFLTAIFGGIFAYVVTPKQYNPEIVLPAFQVSVPFPGATAEEVENFVTNELEEKIADIEGVDKIYARSIDGGMAIVNVQFFVGENLENAKVKLQSKLAENSDPKIGAMETPLIKNINPEDVPIITYGFTSKTLTQNAVRTKVIALMNEIRKIPAVANLEVHGGEKRALRVILDPDKMKFRQVSTTDVQNAIESNNIKYPSGVIQDRENFEEIEVDGTFTDAETAKNILISPGIKLADIADVYDDYREKSSFVQVVKNKKIEDAVFLSIAKIKGANAIQVSTEIQKAVNTEFKKPQYGELQAEVFHDDGKVAKTAINGLFGNIVSSVIIVFLVLLLFLGFRPSVIVAIAIPLTLALTFFVGFLFDQTINRITLFALILSLGLLVDSATVVIENIYRHIRLSDDKKTAIINAVNEVGVGLFLSTITSVIVFLPTAYISGMMGEYMGPLSFFVPTALIMSLLIAYKITPFLADILINRQNVNEEKRGFFDKIADKYAAILEKLLAKKSRQKKFLGIVFALLLIVFTFPVLELVHFKMLPTADKEQFYVYIDAPAGTNYPQTAKISQEVARVLQAEKEVVSVQSFIGEPPIIDFNGLYKSANLRRAPYLATLRVNLTDPADRQSKSEEIVQNMRKKIRADQVLQEFLRNDVKIRLIEDPPGPPTVATLQAKIKGADRETREKIAADLVQKFQNTAEVVDVYTSIEKSFPKTVFSVNHEKALNSGVNTLQIAVALKSALGPLEVAQYHPKNQNELAFIEMQFARENRTTIEDLAKIHVKSQAGEMVPLSAIVNKIETRNEPVRYRDEREDTTYVNAEMGKRSVVYAVIDLIKDLRNYQAPNGAKMSSWDLFGLNYRDANGENYRIEWGGEWEMTLENFRDLGIAMLVAFILIYVVLVAQFKSFLSPALIMTTIPLGFIGILPGFALIDTLNGTFLTATSLIGFIALMGIVVNNAILYLEYVDQLEKDGMSLKQALVEAGRTRLRPIVLTSLTTVLGTLTIVSDPVWSGLAWAIVFGLSLSTILTLVVFPVLYNLVKAR